MSCWPAYQVALDDKDRILTLLEGRLETAQRAAATAEGKLAVGVADNAAMRTGRDTTEQRLTAQLQVPSHNPHGNLIALTIQRVGRPGCVLQTLGVRLNE